MQPICSQLQVDLNGTRNFSVGEIVTEKPTPWGVYPDMLRTHIPRIFAQLDIRKSDWGISDFCAEIAKKIYALFLTESLKIQNFFYPGERASLASRVSQEDWRYHEPVKEFLEVGAGLSTYSVTRCLDEFKKAHPRFDYKKTLCDHFENDWKDCVADGWESQEWDEVLKKGFSSFPGKDIIAFPICLNIEHHFVVVVIDRVHKTVEYYDSEGEGVRDATGKYRERGFDMEKALIQMARSFFPGQSDVKILFNGSFQQKDANNCGVYMLDYIQRRLQGETAEQIFANGKDVCGIEKQRLEFAKKFISASENDPLPRTALLV